MKFLGAIAVMVLGLSVCGLAQQNEFKVKHSSDEKQKKSAAVPLPKSAGSASAASANSKQLQAIERENAKASAPPHTAAKKPAPALKPVKSKPNTPINFGASGGAKGSSISNKNTNSYQSRVRQKRAHN